MRIRHCVKRKQNRTEAEEITQAFGILLSAASGNDKQSGDEQENVYVVILALFEFMPSTEFHAKSTHFTASLLIRVSRSLCQSIIIYSSFRIPY